MRYLVDTNIFSEPSKKNPAKQVGLWLQENEANLYTSAFVIAELLNGVEKLEEGERKHRLKAGLNRLVAKLDGRVLSFSLRVAEEWVKLQTELRSKGKSMSLEDSLIAATARRHHLTIATRNVADFADAGVRLFDPFTLPGH